MHKKTLCGDQTVSLKTTPKIDKIEFDDQGYKIFTEKINISGAINSIIPYVASVRTEVVSNQKILAKLAKVQCLGINVGIQDYFDPRGKCYNWSWSQ